MSERKSKIDRRRWIVKREEPALPPRFLYAIWLRWRGDWVQIAGGYFSARSARTDAARWLGPEYRDA